LGIYVDRDASMTLTTHVSRTVSGCFGVLRQIRSIRRSVTRQILLSPVTALVLFKLDYGNVTLPGLHVCLLNRLQSVLRHYNQFVFD